MKNGTRVAAALEFVSLAFFASKAAAARGKVEGTIGGLEQGRSRCPPQSGVRAVKPRRPWSGD
jgi:hypothetical protein